VGGWFFAAGRLCGCDRFPWLGLGGVESLLTYPLVQTHAEMPHYLVSRTGLDDRLLRLSVGLEDVDDLKEDLEQALKKAAQKG